MTVYIGSDVPLPRIPWNESPPPFCVEDVQESQRGVLGHFSKPHVCFVGARDGCSCGFNSPENPEDSDPEDLEVERESRARLAECLRGALQHVTSLELFACWSGDEACEPVYRDTLVPEELLRTKMSFREREFLIVVAKR